MRWPSSGPVVEADVLPRRSVRLSGCFADAPRWVNDCIERQAAGWLCVEHSLRAVYGMRKVGDILAGQLDEVNMHPAATLVSEANKAT